MCGIAGIVGLAPDTPCVDADEVRAMTAQLVHRGPDDEGYYADPSGRCALGFRRLAIIDLETGQQPITNQAGNVHVVFNGEIYNFRELRDELRAAGHLFRTRGDAEVIVHAYCEWGEDCFERLSGMFAVALWDAERNDLLLARDRFGKKPLYYAFADGRLYFASELKALMAVKCVRREIDPQALHSYLLFQYIPAPHAVYKSVRKLLPGCFLHVRDGEADTAHPFWQMPPSPFQRGKPFTGSYAAARDRLGGLLTRAVERRLVSDVPLGAFLSGGLDSSIVVGLMRKLGVSPLRTFSIGFPDKRYDETAYARMVAGHFDTEHHEASVTPEATDVLDSLAWHYDEPFADSSAIPTYYVSRHTRESVTVALTGDGGDECLAGYDRYRAAAWAAWGDVLPIVGRATIARLGGLLPRGRAKSFTRRLYRFLSAVGKTPARRYLSWVNVFTPEMLGAGYCSDFAERIGFQEPLAWFDHLYEFAPGRAANRAIHTDFASYLPFDLLTKLDIASMAWGLECRSPFLDHELVEFALSLPLSWRMNKRILRDWAAPLLPAAVLRRPKMGFGVPVGEWFRGDLRGLLEQRLFAPDALCARIFRPKWLRTFVDQHLSGRHNHEHPLWALLMLELWHGRWQPTVW